MLIHIIIFLAGATFGVFTLALVSINKGESED